MDVEHLTRALKMCFCQECGTSKTDMLDAYDPERPFVNLYRLASIGKLPMEVIERAVVLCWDCRSFVAPEIPMRD